MGYQITFKPSEEKMELYKKALGNNQYNNIDDNTENAKRVASNKRSILKYCMNNAKNKQDYFTSNAQLDMLIRLLAYSIEMEEKASAYLRWKNDENNELWYCGWEFAHESDIEYEDIISGALDQLSIFSDIVETPSYFEENTNFYKKIDDINSYLDELTCSFEDYYVHKIVTDLDEFKVHDDLDEESDNGIDEISNESKDEL